MSNFYIELDIKELNLFYHPFNDNELSPEVCNYLEKEITKAEKDSQIIIKLNLKTEIETEKVHNMINLIRKNYGHIINETYAKKKETNKKRLSLVIIGLILITFADLLSSILSVFFAELISIIGTVIVWQVFSNIIFEDELQRTLIRQSKQLSNATTKVFINGVAVDNQKGEKN